MMIRRCVICKKRSSAYVLLRLQIHQNNHLNVCFLRAYKESTIGSQKKNINIDKKQTTASAWLCIKESCIAAVRKNPQRLRSSFDRTPSVKTFVQQLQNVFAHELCRYVTHLYRQGNTRKIQHVLDDQKPHTLMKPEYNLILLHQGNISLQENEIQRHRKNSKIYLYKSFSCNIHQKFPYDIALWDRSVKQKYKNRTQRIQRILDIWARLRYID